MASNAPSDNPETASLGRMDAAALEARIRELVDERRRLVRQRRIHLLLLGLAVSLPIHIAIIIWLSLSYKALPAGPAGPAPVVLDLSVLPDETLQDMLEPVETEDMLTPELEIDPGDEALALELEQTALPSLEIDRGASGLTTDIAGSATGGGAGLGAGQGAGTAFFGIQARGNRFAYVVDISGSMARNDRLVLAMGELQRSIEALPDFAQFKIALYSDDVVVPPVQRGWLRASRGRVRSIANWLQREVGARGSTQPLPAFRYLWSDDERPDVVFFLTDGEIPDSTAAEVMTLNSRPGGRPAVINCIAFSADASQSELRDIARRSEGVFRFVPDQGGRP